ALPAGAIVDLPARRGRELAGWLRQRAAAEGLQVSEEATRLLIEWVGEDGAVLLGEVRKAALAGGADNRSVGVNEVGAIVGERRLADVFELTRAVQRRDCVLALKTLERLLTTEEPMRMLALLARDLRLAWTVRTLTEAGQSPAEIARALRLPPAAGQRRAGLRTRPCRPARRWSRCASRRARRSPAMGAADAACWCRTSSVSTRTPSGSSRPRASSTRPPRGRSCSRRRRPG